MNSFDRLPVALLAVFTLGLGLLSTSARAETDNTPPAYSGWYWGTANQTEQCQVGLPNGLRGPISIQWTDSHGRTDGCIFIASKLSETPEVAKASGTDGHQRCKIRLHFDGSGELLSADFSYGGIFNFGYDVSCTALKELREF
jgi:hypothetical protein